MTLSDKAKKGKKEAGVVSALCFAVSAFSLLTFNFLMAAIGFASAHYMKKGSLAAKNLMLILRIADIPVLLLVSSIAGSFSGVLRAAATILIVLIAILDAAILITLVFSENLDSYFSEIYTSDAEQNED